MGANTWLLLSFGCHLDTWDFRWTILPLKPASAHRPGIVSGPTLSVDQSAWTPKRTMQWGLPDRQKEPPAGWFEVLLRGNWRDHEIAQCANPIWTNQSHGIGKRFLGGSEWRMMVKKVEKSGQNIGWFSGCNSNFLNFFKLPKFRKKLTFPNLSGWNSSNHWYGETTEWTTRLCNVCKSSQLVFSRWCIYPPINPLWRFPQVPRADFMIISGTWMDVGHGKILKMCCCMAVTWRNIFSVDGSEIQLTDPLRLV